LMTFAAVLPRIFGEPQRRRRSDGHDAPADDEGP
jgi:hypothetical protein